MNLQSLVDAILDKVARRTRFFGFYLYEVVSDTHGKVELRRVGDAGGYPDLPGRITKLYGSHGITCVSTVGSQVLVGFEGGNDARPYVAFYLTGNPVSMLIDADEEIQIATTLVTGLGPPGHLKHVYVGSKERHKVARQDDPVYCGQIQIVAGAGIVQFIQITHDGTTRPLGTLAASSLVFTPDPSSIGVALMDGHIAGGSELFSSE